MTDNRVFIDIHAIQTLPPSCVNRDDTGSPKGCMYGGVWRDRVSSQAWKHAMRKYFLEHSDADVGIRSTDVVRYIADRIKEKDPSVADKKALEMSEKLFKAAKIGLKDHKTKALFFLGRQQAENLADAAIRGETDNDTICRIFSEHPSVDIALFGRMVADNKELTADASAQVAHAISTHEVHTEFDYYTGTDDLAKDTSGASMLGTIEYNSATLYRYATIALHDLEHQLGDKEQAAAAVKLFVEAFAKSMPTGKINTFANQTIPDLLMVNIRTDRPVSLVTAYEVPVKSAKEGYVSLSIEKLFAEAEKVTKFVDKPYRTFFVATSSVKAPDWAEEENNINDLLNHVSENAADLL